MSMFPHTITVYNATTELGPDFSETPVNYITVIRGALWDDSKAVNVRQSGLEGADAVNIYIPSTAEIVDGVTGEEKTWREPIEFWAADDKSRLWTISLDGKGGTTFIVKGEVVIPDGTFEQINAAHGDVINVTKCDYKDFGGHMSHWEVGGS